MSRRIRNRSEFACSILKEICLLSRTRPILASLGGELSNKITAASPNSYVRDFLCLTLAAAPGSITAGIARAVKPEGHVVGVDRDEALLEMARTEHAGIENLQF
ncbi:MAG TPA: hypothetical protein VFE27_19520 [Acidobacteriaceae bacterium]|nr:hypothetical protein [Acidobacteriaceae bacterium]